jgi:arylsulfatase A-like enzyme
MSTRLTLTQPAAPEGRPSISPAFQRWGRGLHAIVLLAFATTALAAQKPAEPARPNIVLILADDLGYGDPRCYNPQSKIPTPNIDRLAAEGMRFTDAHTPSSVCTPTRYGLLTGRYCWRTRLKSGVLQGYDPLLIEPGRPTLASMLKSRGYATGGIGKWHLGLGTTKPTDYDHPFPAGPQTVGFDYYFGIPSSLDFPPYVFIENDHAVERPTAQIEASEMRRKGGNGFWRAGAIAPSFKHDNVLPELTRKAEAFIAKQTPDRPFFLYLPLNSPHTPWMPTSEFRGKSGAGYYGDFVVQTDATVGRVLKALDDRKLAKNTLVVFTSDNGAHWLPSDIQEWGHRANKDWRGQKSDIWDAGHRVPLIVRWPGKVKAGSTSEQLSCHTDFFATFSEAVGAPLPRDAAEDSFSLLPALLGRKPTGPVREDVIHHSGDGLFAVRSQGWKLVEGLGSGGFTPPKTEKPRPGGPEGQLYHLTEDPAEQRNLYLERPDQVSRLKALLDGYRDRGRSRPE